MERNRRTNLPDNGPVHAIVVTLFKAKNNGRVATREELKEAAADECGNFALMTDTSLNQHIKNIRGAIGEFGYKIEAKRSFGYRVLSPHDK